MKRRRQPCGFCGAPRAEYQGSRAAVCRDCVLRLAAARGWGPAVIPPEPAGPEWVGLQDLLAEFPQARLSALHVGHRGRLHLEGPLPPDFLKALGDGLERVVRGGEGPVVEVVASRGELQALGRLPTTAGPMAVPIPGRAGAVDEMAEGPWLAAWDCWRGHLPPGGDRDLAEALAALVRWDLGACAEALRRVEPPSAEVRLLEALRLVRQGGRGDWGAAADLLALAVQAGPVGDAARYNRARLLLALGQPRPAERCLEGLDLLDARTLAAAVTPELEHLGECRQGLHRIARALEEYRASAGAWPDTLEALAPRFLTLLPDCEGRSFSYRPGSRGFRLTCPGHPGLPKGFPLWHPRLGVLCGPDEVPRRVAPSIQAASGPLESMAPARPLRGGWLSACRESAGDVEGALEALQGMEGAEAALNRALLRIRLGPPGDPEADLQAAVRTAGPELPWGPLLERRLEAALASKATGSLVRSRRALLLALAGRVPLGPSAWEGLRREEWADERLRYLGEAAVRRGRLPRPVSTDWRVLLRQGLAQGFDHVAPEAALYLEQAAFASPGEGSWILLVAARIYRQALRWEAARSALEEARRLGADPAFLPWGLPRDDDPQTLMVEVMVEESLGHLEEALRRCRHLRKRFPGWPSPRLFEALLLDRLGRRQEALDTVLTGLEERPRHVLLRVLLTRLLPESAAALHRERLRELRPDLEDPSVLDVRVIDPPDPFAGLPPGCLDPGGPA